MRDLQRNPNRSLDDAALCRFRRNTERTLLSCGALLRDIHPLDRTGLPRSGAVLHPVGKVSLARRGEHHRPVHARRTLSSVLAREWSINFCKLRTRLRSPSCDAVKIRCRRRRTSPSTARQSIACQPRGSSSGPFTTPTTPGASCCAPVVRIVMASNLPFGSGAVVSASAQAHLTRVSTLSGPGTRPVSGQLSGDDRRRGRPHCPGFPSPFDVPAFASRVIRCPPGDWAFLTVGLSDQRSVRTLTGLPRSTRTSYDRDGVPPVSRGRRCSPGRQEIPDRRLPLCHGQPLHPARTTHQRGSRITRHQRRFTRFTRPILPSPVTPRWNGDPRA